MARRASTPVPPAGIPEKPFFKIGEVAKLCAVKPFVLRFWETEFKTLKPQKSRSGQRLYRRRDVEHALRIRQLLYDERFTIEGARTRLRELGHDEAAPAPLPPPEVDRAALARFKQGIVDILALVDD